MKDIKTKERLSFWNGRAKLGFAAGSNDEILKRLEINEISKYLKDGLKILEIGCGNGVTALEYVKKFNVEIFAIDYSKEMIKEAKILLEKNQNDIKGKVEFEEMNLNEIDSISSRFDLIFCERVLINLDNWQQQEAILIKISTLLKSKGIFCMCENSIEGLNSINSFRANCNLEEIVPPWHNRYFQEDELVKFSNEKRMCLKEVHCFTSTYYFLSRVINAKLASENGQEPKYDSPINNLAFSLPSIGEFGQTKLWVWLKGI